MRSETTKRPSAATVLAAAGLLVAMVALVVALAGTATGLPGKNRIDRNDLRKRVVGPIHMRKNSVRAFQLAPRSTRTVHIANGAVKQSNSAPNAVNNQHTALFKSSALQKVSAAPSQGGAPQITLLQRGPLAIYGKCFFFAGDIRGEVYLRSTQLGAVLASDTDNLDGDGPEPAAGYVNPGEDENDHEILTATSNAPVGQSAARDQGPFIAIQGSTVIEGRAVVFIKLGTTINGDGPYGTGDRCMFHAFSAGTGP
jgi:hypothetical protein